MMRMNEPVPCIPKCFVITCVSMWWSSWVIPGSSRLHACLSKRLAIFIVLAAAFPE
jgi:hypothetical protein